MPVIDALLALVRSAPVPVIGNLAVMGAAVALFLAPLHVMRRR
jgi:hypothetical protein